MCLYKKNYSLYQDNSRRKYLVIDKTKYWIPDSETRNAMGFRLSEFRPATDKELNEFQTGRSVDSIKNVRLIRDINNPRDVYALFQSPCEEKRHIPNQKTRNAIGRRRREIEELPTEVFNKYPTGTRIDDYENWDGMDNTPTLTEGESKESDKSDMNYYNKAVDRAKHSPLLAFIMVISIVLIAVLTILNEIFDLTDRVFKKENIESQQFQQKDSSVTKLATSSESTPKQKSLYEYFTTDFPQYLSMSQNIGMTIFASSSATNKKEDYKLEFRLHCDFDSLTKFISVYLPSSTYPNAKIIVEEIAVEAPDIADAISSSSGMIVSGSRYGDRASETKDLKFSGRVYIYNQANLSKDDIYWFRKFYKEKDLDLIFRNSNYQTTRWL